MALTKTEEVLGECKNMDITKCINMDLLKGCFYNYPKIDHHRKSYNKLFYCK